MTLDDIINEYETVVKVVDNTAKIQQDRAYGGMIRAIKGMLQEHITEELVKYAWNELNGDLNRLEINSKKIPVKINQDYIKRIKNQQVRDYIYKHLDDYHYNISVDKHVFIDKKFVMGIECKAYTENAMLKRILVDFHLLKTVYPNLSCHLFQLESQLGGDYSELNKITYGSYSTHSIMSYFPDVDLQITTLLRGERKIEEPIHKYFKPLEKDTLTGAVKLLQKTLKLYL